jgi:hypothetical protein
MSRRLFCLQLWYRTFQLHPGSLLRRQLEHWRSELWGTVEVRRIKLVCQEWFVYSASIALIFCGCAPATAAAAADQQTGKANEDDASGTAHSAADNCSRMALLGCWNRTRRRGTARRLRWWTPRCFHDLAIPSRSGTKRYPPKIVSSAGELHSGTW